MSRCPSCENCVYLEYSLYESPCSECQKAFDENRTKPGFKLKSAVQNTKRDQLRSMTDEELAQFIFRDPEHLYMKSPNEIVDWLQSPAEGAP